MEHKRSLDPNVFMNSTFVAKITKNKLEEIRISILKNNKIDVRTHFFFPGQTDPKPTKKGIWLSFDQAKSIVEAFDKYIKNNSDEFNLEFEKTEKEKMRVYIGEFKGKKLVHIRFFYIKDGEFNPGKGICFPVSIIKDMSEGLKKTATMKESSSTSNNASKP